MNPGPPITRVRDWAMAVVITEPEYDFLSSLRFWSDSILFKKINKQTILGRKDREKKREGMEEGR